MWVSKRFDLTFRDLAAGLRACVVAGDLNAELTRLERSWAPDGSGLACLSVRSGFDALLSHLRLPPGSEILFTAMTVADMPRIARHHGLVPVPIDVDLATMTPSERQLAAAKSDRTRAVVLTHLFGGRADFTAAVAWARGQGLFVIEDCAEAFWDAEYRGNPEADISLFSFGPIKHATALGGALLSVEDRELRDGLRHQLSEWPVQSTVRYATRLLKYSVLHAVSFRLPYRLLAGGARLLGLDHDRLVNALTRGFRGPRFFERLRRRPCAALVRLLHRRLVGVGRRIAQREAKGRLLAEAIGRAVPCPGAAASPHSFWIFPVLPADVTGTRTALRQAGFDATVGRSFALVAGGNGGCPNAERIINHAIYLPFYPAMPDAELLRMAEVVRREP